MKAGKAAAVIGVVLVAAWVYGPALHGGWVWDDGLEVAANPLLRDPHGWWQAWAGPTGLDYLPLKTLLQWIEWQLWGSHVLGYHLANVALHLAGALLLGRLVARLGLPGGGFAAALFALHPMAVESVAWIAEFKNVVSLPFLLLALIAWVSGRSRTVAWLWFAAALLCKPSPVMFPVMLLVFAWWQRGRVARRDLLESVPFFAASAAIGMVTLDMQWHHAMSGSPAPALARWSGANLLSYVGTALWPFRWSPVYGPWHAGWLPVVGWASVLGLLALAWAKRASWGRPALLILAWLLCATLPVIGLLPMAYQRVAPRADHLGYLALGGICAALGVMFASVSTRRSRVAVTALLLGLLGVFAVRSHAYAAAYRDERSLWAFAVRRVPDAWLARNNLGRAELAAGQAQAALAELRAAAALEPDSAEVHGNAGAALLALGQGRAALGEFRRAAQLAPDSAGIRYDLGRALLQSGDAAGAVDELRAAIRLDPGHAGAHNNLGLALVRRGQTAAGVAEFRRALALDPHMAEAHLNLGNAAFRGGDPAAAAAEYRQALAIDPTSPGAQRNLAAALRVLAENPKR